MSKPCARCDEQGTVECWKCDGKGRIDREPYIPGFSEAASFIDSDFDTTDPCEKCEETGQATCPTCNGAGVVDDN